MEASWHVASTRKLDKFIARKSAVTSSIFLTEQLQRFSAGDRDVAEAVLREVLPKLHQIAARELRRERYFAPLSPTELINEVWIRSLGKGGWQVSSRQHFYAIAALAMRRVLVDFARSRLTQRRGEGAQPDQLDENSLNHRVETVNADTINLESTVRIGALMDQLENANSEAARIVDMHYFAGFTFEEIAEITGLSFRQVRHRWEKGRDWLKDRL